jgi:hypothetical protein
LDCDVRSGFCKIGGGFAAPEQVNPLWAVYILPKVLSDDREAAAILR